jgi:hypothetical protein
MSSEGERGEDKRRVVAQKRESLACRLTPLVRRPTTVTTFVPYCATV